VIGPAATTLFGPSIKLVLSAGESTRGIRPAGEDPCCCSFAYLPSPLLWMSDAFRSLILPANQKPKTYKFTHSNLDWRGRKEIGTSFRDLEWLNPAIVPEALESLDSGLAPGAGYSPG
jgi:hypothetical protein